MAVFPASGYLSNSSRTIDQMKTAMEAQLATIKQMFSAEDGGVTVHTISGGSITPTSCITVVDTSGGTADLDRIDPTNMHDGAIIALWPASLPTNLVTVKHNQGGANEIILNQEGPGYTAGSRDFDLSSYTRFLMLKWDATAGEWQEWQRNVGHTWGRTIFTTSGNFIVPQGVTLVTATVVGGGGGGGGSYGTTGNGTNGGVGGASAFDTIGGVGGSKGFASTNTVFPTPGRGGSGVNGVNEGGHGQQGDATNSFFAGYGGHGGAGAWTIDNLSERFGHGGAGGDGHSGGEHGGGGGAGGGVSVKHNIAVTPGAPLTVTIGAGGTAGAAGSGSPAGNAGSVGVAGAVMVEW